MAYETYYFIPQHVYQPIAPQHPQLLEPCNTNPIFQPVNIVLPLTSEPNLTNNSDQPLPQEEISLLVDPNLNTFPISPLPLSSPITTFITTKIIKSHDITHTILPSTIVTTPATEKIQKASLESIQLTETER